MNVLNVIIMDILNYDVVQMKYQECQDTGIIQTKRVYFGKTFWDEENGASYEITIEEKWEETACHCLSDI